MEISWLNLAPWNPKSLFSWPWKKVHGFFNTFSQDFHEKEIRSVCFKICSGAYNQWLTLYTCNCALSVNTYDNRQNTVQWNPALRTPVYNRPVLFVTTESSYHFFPGINLLNTDTSLYGQQTPLCVPSHKLL